MQKGNLNKKLGCFMSVVDCWSKERKFVRLKEYLKELVAFDVIKDIKEIWRV